MGTPLWSPGSPRRFGDGFSLPNKSSTLPGGFFPHGKLGQASAAPGSHPESQFPWLRQDPGEFSTIPAQSRSWEKSLLLPPPWTSRDSLSRAGSSGVGICPSQCVGSLWSWGRSVGQEVLRDEPAASMGMADPSLDEGKERNQLSWEGGFEGSVARNPPSHSINVCGLCKALSAAAKAR